MAASRVRELEQRIRELERLLGKKTMENEILAGSPGGRALKKTALAQPLAARGGPHEDHREDLGRLPLQSG